jgi:hypothetical protein
MQPDYLKQAQSFLALNSARLALRAVPMALVAVAAAQAQPVFNPPTTHTISGCIGSSVMGALTGTSTNSGVSLSGNPSLTYAASGGSCNLLMVWKGTGSGAFTSASYSSSFVITPPNNVTVTGYSLTLLINGVAQPPVTCSSQEELTVSKPVNRLKPRGEVVAGCAGNITVPVTNISASGTLSTYEADLSITGFWNFGNSTTLNVSIPAGASIDIAATAPAVTVPALSPVALAGTALLLALAAFRMARWRLQTAVDPLESSCRVDAPATVALAGGSAVSARFPVATSAQQVSPRITHPAESTGATNACRDTCSSSSRC